MHAFVVAEKNHAPKYIYNNNNYAAFRMSGVAK